MRFLLSILSIIAPLLLAVCRPHSEVESQNGPQPQTSSTAGRLAEKYTVSRNTIRRDAKLSEAIDAIGEISPGAIKITVG